MSKHPLFTQSTDVIIDVLREHVRYVYNDEPTQICMLAAANRLEDYYKKEKEERRNYANRLKRQRENNIFP